jgi:protein involved in polysaccharide export with SLBB domain
VAVPGRFAFREGLRIHDLLSLATPGDQVLPRTYLARGELLRTLPDGSTRLLAFALDGALRGEASDDLLLQARDRITLTDLADLRPPRTVTVLGPLARPGTYDWHDGMRASDLLFKAGVPELRASRHEAELARFQEGGFAVVRRLDLARLLATEAKAPVRLDDEAVNPKLNPYDQITVYEDPAFRLHPTVQVTGQVQRPGPYVLTGEACTLKELIQRAGGLRPEAMPAGGVFLRARGADTGTPGQEAAVRDGLASFNEVLQRLNETRRGKDSGALEPNPLLHGLLTGDLNRLVVDFPAALGGDARQDVTLLDGDRVHIPRRTDSVYVVGEVASPFSAFHVKPGDQVKDVLKLAGGYTRNADVAQVRLLKASGRIVDEAVARAAMDPGDALLVPQRIRKDVPWQDSLLAMTPLAILFNALSR